MTRATRATRAKGWCKLLQVCWKEQTDRLQDVKGTYENRIKICNDKASLGLRAAKTKYDQQIQKTATLRSAMKQILRECLETNEFVKCIAGRTKEVVKRRKQITERLSETIKNAEFSAVEQLKEATKCHADAQVEALKSLQKILKDTKDCILWWDAAKKEVWLKIHLRDRPFCCTNFL